MASATKLEMVNRQLRSVLLSEKAGIAVSRLQGEYRGLTGEFLPFKEFGFPTLEAYLSSIPNVASLKRGPSDALICTGVADDTTQHIASLVSRQKSKKKNRIGIKAKAGGRYHNPASYFSRPKPIYSTYNKPKPVKPMIRTSPSFTYNRNGPSSRFTNPQKPVKFTAVQNPARPVQSVKPSYQLDTNYNQSSPSIPAIDKEIVAAAGRGAKPSAPAAPKKPHTKTLASNNNVTSAGKPGPWSGKLGSKKTTNELNKESAKPVYENLYITVENDVSRGKEKGKAKGKPIVRGKKPEWQSTFDVPPRFKKRTSPGGLVQQGPICDREVIVNVWGSPSSPAGSASSGSSSSSDQTSPRHTVDEPQVDSATANWIQQTLREKPNGVWSSALCNMHKEEFGRELDASIVEQMSKLSLIQKESTMNCDILYPKLTIQVRESPRSNTSKRSVNFGAGDGHGIIGENYENQLVQLVSEERKKNRLPSIPNDDLTRGRCSPTIVAPTVPALQLPEDSEWIAYIAYIRSLSDFYVLLIGDDYSEQLIILEEEMRMFYSCSTWSLTERPEVDACYASEFNREWLRVQVIEVNGDQVKCFLLDHGDTEMSSIDCLRPLAEHFLQLPFQVIHCRLRHSEQVAHDDGMALQMFCQLALGKRLLAEVLSRDGDRIEMDLFDDSDISIFEQCITAGI